MKKLLFILLATCLSIASYAGDLKVQGDKKVLKEKATADIVFDFSQTTWEEDETFVDYCNDGTYDERIAMSKTSLVDAFNQKSKGLKLTENATDAAYKVVVRVDNFVQKQGGVMWGRMYIKIYGEITVQDAKTGETVLTVTVKGLSGNSDFAPLDRFKKSFAALGEELAKL